MNDVPLRENCKNKYQLPRSSGSLGSRSFLSTVTSRLARAFSTAPNSPNIPDGSFTYEQRRHSSGNKSAIAKSWAGSSFSTVPFRPPQIMVSDLSDYMDYKGTITMRTKLKRDVFERGLDSSIRQLIWPIILGVFPSSMNQNERVAWMRKHSNEYFKFRSEWQNILLRHGGKRSQPLHRSSPYGCQNEQSVDVGYLKSMITAVRKDSIRMYSLNNNYNYGNKLFFRY